MRSYLSKVKWRWSQLSSPIKIALIISTFGIITSLSYFAFVQPSQISEVNIIPPPVSRPIPTPSPSPIPTSYPTPTPTLIPSPSPIPSPIATPTATVTLTASPPPTNLYLGQEKTFNINAHVNNDRLTAIQLDFHYDEYKLNLTNLTPTDYLPNILASPSYGPGIITATFAVPPDSGGRTNWGTVANFTITPFALGSAIIQFGPSTVATTINSSTNMLLPTSTIHVNIHNLGDINADGVVNIFDYNIFVSEYGKTGYSSADLNQDQIVNIFDYNIFVTNYGLTTPTQTN